MSLLYYYVLYFFFFFFLMIRRPPRSTLLSLHDALPISPEPLLTVTSPMSTPSLAASFPIALVPAGRAASRSEEHTSELQSQSNLVCRLLLEKKKKKKP